MKPNAPVLHDHLLTDVRLAQLTASVGTTLEHLAILRAVEVGVHPDRR